MQALVFDRPAPDTSATRIASIEPPVAATGQLLVRVSHAGINFKDVMSRRGDPGYAAQWPYVPGVEVAGTVLSAAGEFSAGQPVVALTNEGGLAEVAVASAALTVPLPAGLDPAVAATAPGALTTALLLHDVAARVQAADVVLVHSAGGAVGRALADVTRIRSGARLVGVVGAASRVEPARAAGYSDVLVRSPALAADVRALTGGVSVVLDPQGTAFLSQDLDALTPGGRIVLFGNASGGALESLPPAGALFRLNASIGGFSLAALSAAAPGVVASAMRSALAMMAAGESTAEVIELSGLDAAPAAQEALAAGNGRGKYVVAL